MSQEAVQLNNIEEVVRYWNDCIADVEHSSIRDAAWQIADVMGNDRFGEWYREGQGDPLFVEAVNLATDLEVPVHLRYPDEVSRDAAWARLRHLVMALGKKHLHQHTLPRR
jgi:hypothetical protein